jgi:hypothetical protein
MLLLAGLWFSDEAEKAAEPGAVVLGGVVLTVIPVSIGAILEAAWRKRRRRRSPARGRASS